MNPTEFNQKIAEVRNDRDRGASELARYCLDILAWAARELPVDEVTPWRETLFRFACELAETRPSMAPIANLLRQWREALARDCIMELPLARHTAVARAEALIALSRRAVIECADHTAGLLGSNRTVMTHSFSSTVLEVCRLLKDTGLRMIVTESRPREEGRQLARQLSSWGVPTTYITDAQMGVFVARADAVLVGADSLLADGAIVNKAGTHLLALAAQENKVAFYVCCESFKRHEAGESPAMEEMSQTELGVPDWPAVTVRNVYFEVTPARLVSAWIDEKGVRHRIEKP